MCVVGIPVEAQTGRNEHLGTRHFAYLNAKALRSRIFIECRVRRGVVEHHGDVDAQAQRSVEVAVYVPLVLCVETELSGFEVGRILRVTVGERRIGVFVHKLRGVVGQEVFE